MSEGNGESSRRRHHKRRRSSSRDRDRKSKRSSDNHNRTRKRKRSPRGSSPGRPRKRARDEDRFEERRKRNKLEEIRDFVDKELVQLLEVYHAVKKQLIAGGMLEMAQKEIDFEKIEKNRFFNINSTLDLSQKNGNEGPKALMVDEHGREIDDMGRIIQTVPLIPSTLMVNQKLQNKAKEKREKELKRNSLLMIEKENPYYDPKGLSLGRRPHRPTFNWIKPGTAKDLLAPPTNEEKIENDNMTQVQDGEVKEKTAEEKKIDDDTEFNMEMLKFEKSLMLPELPTVEWWDKDYLQGMNGEEPKDYGKDDDIPIVESKINSLIVRPVAIPPPNERNKQEAPDIKLTRKERKKLIRITRANKRKEEREEILLGIKEAPKPRVRIANMMRVYGTEAMQDPTYLETIVRKEMREREQRHEQRNQERKLTDTQRREKRRRKFLEDISLSANVAVFKVLDLSNKLAKLKVDMNASQFLLSGCCLITPRFSVIIIEGGPKAIRRYKKLMLKRMKWGEQEINDPDDHKKKIKNKCQLIWEGDVLKPSFIEFQVKKFKHILHARKFLLERGLHHYFDLARTYVDQ